MNDMKLQWETPRIEVEAFEANEYVSSCVTANSGALYCAIPGYSFNYVQDGLTAKYGPDGHLHGQTCATNCSISDLANGVAMENGANGHVISNIQVGSQVNGLTTQIYNSQDGFVLGTFDPSVVTDADATYYFKATWTSYDDAKLRYDHFGIAALVGAWLDAGNPNRS